MKIEPGFFQVFFKPGKNTVKTRKKPGKNPAKTQKKPVGKCGEPAESWGSGDVVTDRGRTTHVPARGKTPEKTRFNFSPTPSSPTPFGRSRCCEGGRGLLVAPCSGPQKMHKHKDFHQKPPTQTPPSREPLTPLNSLCMGPLCPSKYRKKPIHKEFRGLRVPKILYALILCVFYLLLTCCSDM